MKIVSIVGARPQFINEYIISKMVRKICDYVVIHTGQHYDFEMSQIFFDQLGLLEPDYNLGIGSATHGEQTGKMLIKIESLLIKEKPDVVLVYGDTNSTLAGALSAVKLNIPVGHVEAGLRSFDKTMPEEVNRILTDHCSSLLFAPTKTAKENLIKEGIKKGVYVTGDVMYDALVHNLKIAEKSKILKQLRIKPNQYYLTTIHRQSNTDDIKNLSNIIEALSEINEKVIFPVHPRTKKLIKKYNLNKKMKKNIKNTKPFGYFDFIWLEKNAKKILTDSGGVQKEAYILKIPCITLRENTEWVETVKDKWNILVGSDKDKILDAVYNFQPKQKQHQYFGEGRACQNIVKILKEYIK
ncbi:MAG: non-hydrolyzing UDP-N-acetylglucosamine 2-epimerase [Thermoplasmatota archaeon]